MWSVNAFVIVAILGNGQAKPLRFLLMKMGIFMEKVKRIEFTQNFGQCQKKYALLLLKSHSNSTEVLGKT